MGPCISRSSNNSHHKVVLIGSKNSGKSKFFDIFQDKVKGVRIPQGDDSLEITKFTVNGKSITVYNLSEEHPHLWPNYYHNVSKIIYFWNISEEKGDEDFQKVMSSPDLNEKNVSIVFTGEINGESAQALKERLLPEQFPEIMSYAVDLLKRFYSYNSDDSVDEIGNHLILFN